MQNRHSKAFPGPEYRLDQARFSIHHSLDAHLGAKDVGNKTISCNQARIDPVPLTLDCGRSAHNVQRV
jgi:hypothetical protein